MLVQSVNVERTSDLSSAPTDLGTASGEMEDPVAAHENLRYRVVPDMGYHQLPQTPWAYTPGERQTESVPFGAV